MNRLTGPLRIQQTQLPMVVRRMAGPLLLLDLVVLTVFLARSFGVTPKTVPGLTSCFDAGRTEMAAPKERALLSDRIARFFGIGA